MNTAVGGAGASRHDRPRLRRQSVNPFAERDGLPGLLVDAESGPIAFALDLLIRDRALNNQDERRAEPIFGGGPPVLKEIFAALLVGQHPVMQVDLWQTGDRSEEHVLDTGLLGVRDRDRVAVTTHPVRGPEYMNLFDVWWPLTQARFCGLHRCSSNLVN